MRESFNIPEYALSCDTMAVSSERSALGCNMFVKNSDRPLIEQQPLTYVPPADHTEKEVILTGGFAIPQVSHTYGHVGSGPWWIWGLEMGVNEHGLMIGNEAVFDKELGKEKEKGILGMDLIRLALERTKSAEEAVKLIADLLEKYGQNRSAMAHVDEKGYDNSFLLVDTHEIWIMETTGRRWIAKKEKGVVNIGNTYSLHGQYDLCSEDLEQYARGQGWLWPDEPFDFARAYTLRSSYQTIAQLRRRRVRQLGNAVPKHGPADLKRIFRDHYEGEELLGPIGGATSGTFPTVCRHACASRTGETTACMIGWYSSFGIHLRFALAQPCCSIFLPVYYGIPLPEILTKREEFYCEDSLWWELEKLGKLVNLNYDRFAPAVRRRFSEMEEELEKEAERVEGEAKRIEDEAKYMKAEAQPATAAAMGLHSEYKSAEAQAVLKDFVDVWAVKALAAAREEQKKIEKTIRKIGGVYGPARDFWNDYCEKTHTVKYL